MIHAITSLGEHLYKCFGMVLSVLSASAGDRPFGMQAFRSTCVSKYLNLSIGLFLILEVLEFRKEFRVVFSKFFGNPIDAVLDESSDAGFLRWLAQLDVLLDLIEICGDSAAWFVHVRHCSNALLLQDVFA